MAQRKKAGVRRGEARNETVRKASPARKKKAGRKKATVRKKAAVRKKVTRRKVAKTTTTRRKTGRAAPKPKQDSPPGYIRLNKYLADNGIASRRAADLMIEEGHIWVDGVQVTELGIKVDPTTQVIEVDGEVVRSQPGGSHRYYLLNKPPGVVCTNDVRENRPRAIDLITDRHKGRIYTVGRLDEASKGLIILTNDGDFANRVMHPRYGVSKTYMVKLRGRIDDKSAQKVRDGVFLSDGRTSGARVVIRKRTRDYSHLLVTIYEGMNREIRRVFSNVGFNVVDLRRARIGNITDRGLKLGHWRMLTREEVRELLDVQDGDSGARDSRGRRKGARRTGRS